MNTPILGIKSNDKWRLVQDIWIISALSLYFTVLNSWMSQIFFSHWFEGCFLELINHPLPMALKQLRRLLGITGCCRIWIPGYGELAQSLYKLITENQQAQTNKLVWSPQTQKAFEGSPTCSSAGSNFELAHRIFLTEKKAKATCLKGNCYYCFANGLNLISLLMGKILLYRLLNT